MQNRGALWIFTILLALACLWQLSFSWFTGRVEDNAKVETAPGTYLWDSAVAAKGAASAIDTAKLLLELENRYIRDHANDVVYPVMGFTYAQCKEKEMNLGLDLRGGMAVTLEVSIPELVVALSDESDDPAFNTAIAAARKAQLSSTKDFISLFDEEYRKADPNGRLSAIFSTGENEGMFGQDDDNAEIIASLKVQAKAALDNTERILRTRIDKFGVSQPSIQKQQFSGRIQIELPGVKDKERVRKVLQSTANLEFWEMYLNTPETFEFLKTANSSLSAALFPELADTLAADTVVADTAVADGGAVVPPDTSAMAVADSNASDTNAVADQLADGDTTTDDGNGGEPTEEERRKYRMENPLMSVLNPYIDGERRFVPGAVIGVSLLADTPAVNTYLQTPAVQRSLPSNMRLAWAAKSRNVNGVTLLDMYALRLTSDGKPRVDGKVIVNAYQDFDNTGGVIVSMSMNSEGAENWRRMTADNIQKPVAVVLDNLVYSAPNVNEEIGGGSSRITMGGGNDIQSNITEATDLATILKAGALPAPARIIDETVVGASIGEDNVQGGLWSFAIAIIVVLIVMILYYARAGWIADIALLCNVFFLLGTMASVGATLTLPGIAGIVLTIGMAVDANVLINERIREELKAGKMLKSAVDLGYKGALSAIIDSNVTTFVTGLILFWFGSGPIKGFATTLMIGIATSLFTAIFISRLVISWRLDRNKDITFWTNWSKNLFSNTNIDFMGKRKMFYVISFVLIAISIGSMATKGFNWGVDFTGGRTYVAEFDNAVDVDQVRSAMEPVVKTEAGRQYTMNVKTYGGDKRLKITTNYLIEDPILGSDSIVQARISDGLAKVGPFHFADETRKVDPTISDDIVKGAITSVLISLVFMFIYIAIRFKNWQYGAGALLSLMHDTIIVLGLYSLLWGIVGFSLEIDEAFIAVILTVIGYSINDTVVVFDRIREYLTDHKREGVVQVFNKAMNLTLSRTLMTGLNVMIVLLIIFFMGSAAIKGFVFGLFVGIVVGTYSSIFVASAVAVDFLKRKEEKQVALAA
ncbi:MAG: protein translocase subunit SecDF [Flavobacteriales bacterium]|nr:protein translocase subunit SecDF [Flavobacteriales bacterium]